MAEIESRIERLMQGFPENIREGGEQTKARKVSPAAVGNFPAP